MEKVPEMNKILNQWEAAAEKFAAEQERSEYAAVNRAVVKERFQVFSGEKVLDLGCGYGYYTDYFSEIGASAVGIDGSEMMIRIAREKYPGRDFSVVNLMNQLPFEDKTFDLV